MNKAMFQKVPNSVDVSEFRASMASHLAKTKHKPLIVSARRGGDSFVVLSVDAYNTLIELWEDEQDAQELVRLRRLQKGKKWVEWKSLKTTHVQNLPKRKSSKRL